jgi:hypothetical protein
MTAYAIYWLAIDYPAHTNRQTTKSAPQAQASSHRSEVTRFLMLFAFGLDYGPAFPL